MKPNTAADFWLKVDKSAGPESCWVWTGTADRAGYGMFRSRPNGTQRAHQFSYVLANGPIPAGLFTLHRCDNPPCVNPDHLFVGTQADNVADMLSKGRGPIGERNGTRLHPERVSRGPRHSAAIENPRKGEEHWRSSLTDETVTEIRSLVGQGVPQKDMAERFGVSRATISLIVARKTWRHIP